MRSSTIATIRTLEDKSPLIHQVRVFSAQGRLDSWKVVLRKREMRFKELSRISRDSRQWNLLTESQQLAIENEKFSIMQQVHESIKKQYGESEQREAEVKLEQANNSFWRKALFGFLMITDITMMSIFGYLGTIQLISLLVPRIAAMTATAISIVATAIEGTMMYSVFKAFLQRGLGIQPDLPQDSLVEKYDKRLALTERMNSLMINNFHYTRKQSVECYGAYASILKCFNQDMRNTQLLPYAESAPKKLGRYCLSALNTGLSIAGTYFGSILLLTAISASLIGTPVGWGIIATVIVAQLLTRFFIRQNAVYDLLNPRAAQHNVVEEKLRKFTDKSHGINQDLIAMHDLSKQRNVARDELLRTVPHRLTRSVECPRFFKPCRSSTEQSADECEKLHVASVRRLTAREC